ncbi:hypothetical protein [Nocardia cyriacigeorgica]|uniref:hypothetical protein n=1 Tax=Nocardia cyriacigeorgica TaxID=135487 RepID=UPI002454298C|nr:hypothetical protein [Nocardia cyriacigeorgica]
MIYEISGGDDSPKVNNFTFTRGDSADEVSFRIVEDETVTTSGPNASLTATVAQIIGPA